MTAPVCYFRCPRFLAPNMHVRRNRGTVFQSPTPLPCYFNNNIQSIHMRMQNIECEKYNTAHVQVYDFYVFT